MITKAAGNIRPNISIKLCDEAFSGVDHDLLANLHVKHLIGDEAAGDPR